MKRALLTLLVLIVAGAFGVALMTSGRDRQAPVQPEPEAVESSPAQAPDAQPTPEQPPEAGPEADPQPAPEADPEAGAVPAPPQPTAEADPAPDNLPDLGPLQVLAAERYRPAVLGSDDAEQPFAMRVALTPYGAGIENIRLATYDITAMGDEPYTVMGAVRIPRIGPDGQMQMVVATHPLAAWSVTLNGQRVALFGQQWELVESTPDRAVYRIVVADEQRQPVLEIRRTFTLPTESYDLRIRQELISRTEQPLAVVWEQNGQADLPVEGASYMGDRRMVVAGHFDLSYDPSRRYIGTEETFEARTDLLDEIEETGTRTINWPAGRLTPQQPVAWVAMLNRYFAAAVHSPLDEPFNPADMTTLTELFPRQALVGFGQTLEDGDDARRLVLRMATEPIALQPNEPARIDLALFAGPRRPELFKEQPYAALGFDKMIIYEMGCTICTFQPIAHGLLALLRGFHAVVQDWAIAIILLVLLVRLILHPITKKSQVNMMKMSKQMQRLQPELEKLKKKYADEPQKFQAEQVRLFRESGVNPLNMLGCAPMFLQTPIWIALYAMLYYAIELRHQPAFYGIFQLVPVGDHGWQFLADLSQPDRFLVFSDQPVHAPIPLLGALDFSALNILPLLWAVTMYFQQKMMTPPAQNEQMAQQQKMMRWMVLLMPLFLYAAPSGLTLYILASTGAGIFDSYLVRKHVKEQEESGKLFESKPRKGGGLMDKLAKAAEEQQKRLENKQTGQPGPRGPKGKGNKRK